MKAVFSPLEFIASITQHIPEPSFHYPAYGAVSDSPLPVYPEKGNHFYSVPGVIKSSTVETIFQQPGEFFEIVEETHLKPGEWEQAIQILSLRKDGLHSVVPKDGNNG